MSETIVTLYEYLDSRFCKNKACWGGHMNRRRKAIVIDDLDFCREVLADALLERGYDVSSYSEAHQLPFCAEDGSGCPSESGCADLILTDNKMPSLSGLEMFEQQIAKGCKLMDGKRAVISGSWTQEEKAKAAAIGCQTFQKPCYLDQLYSWLDKFEKKGKS